MSKTSTGHAVALVTALVMACGPVTAQQQVQVVVDRGLTEDLPYTAIYPSILRTADDGNPATILTLQHPDALLQCDVFAVPATSEAWSAEGALSALDVGGIESDWAPSFPGFKVTGQSVTRFASGPALLYEGSSNSSPFGVPVSIIHAETVASGRTYMVECLLAQDIVAEARPMVDFIIANFSTNSDGQCCIDPADDRG
jgi:hypothetical protein